MVCAICREKARRSREGRASFDGNSHRDCPSVLSGEPTRCDCQHKTERDYINRALVRPAETTSNGGHDGAQ